VLYAFRGGSDGVTPNGDLVFDQAGNLYGTTTFGGGYVCSGGNGCGMVYELTPPAGGGGWTESVVYRFTGGNDGCFPYSGVTFDDYGSLYGTVEGCGYHGYGTVYELSPSGGGWLQNTLYAFAGLDDGGSPFGGLIFDELGTLYGTTSLGGSNGDRDGTVFTMVPSLGNWTFSVLYDFSYPETASGAILTMDAAGNLYGTEDAYVGSGSWGAVYKLTFSNGGWTYNSLHNFSDNDGANPGVVILDATDNVYGIAEFGGAYGQGVAFEITP
jgi:hypothetical protein